MVCQYRWLLCDSSMINLEYRVTCRSRIIFLRQTQFPHLTVINNDHIKFFSNFIFIICNVNHIYKHKKCILFKYCSNISLFNCLIYYYKHISIIINIWIFLNFILRTLFKYSRLLNFFQSNKTVRYFSMCDNYARSD